MMPFRTVPPTEGCGLTFHHIGLAARDPGRTLRLLECLGYRAERRERDPLQKVDLVFCVGDRLPAIEIITPATPGSPVDAMLRERSECLYHLCFSTADAEASLAALRAAGFRCTLLSREKPAILFDNRVVSFHIVDGFGLLELVHESST